MIFRECLGAEAGGSSCFGLGLGLHRLSHLCCGSLLASCELRARASLSSVLVVSGTLRLFDAYAVLGPLLSLASRSLTWRAPVFFLQRAEALPSRWRFLRAWDSSLGFPGEGPTQPALSSAKRAGVDLTSRNLSYETLE